MKRNHLLYLMLSSSSLLFACTANNKDSATQTYQPSSKSLYDSIVNMDSMLFAAYNSCDLEKFASMVSEDIEFYHDQGGLMTSKKGLVEALKTNICGKVSRILEPGTIEVYPIADYGAVEMGSHRFHNRSENPPSTSRSGKFVQIWKKENGQWMLSRVISLH